MHIAKRLLVGLGVTALLAGAGLLSAQSASADQYTATNGTVALSWLTTNTSQPNASTVNWPQTPYTTASCGTGWIQTDVYRYDTPENRAIVDALDDDGYLSLVNGAPEDHAVVVSWSFAQQTACPPPVTPSVAATVTGAAVCDAATSTFTVTWTGAVTGVFEGYVSQRVKYTGVTPPVIVQDAKAPGTGFSYTTSAPGTATSATAAFHVHVTKAAAGVNPLDTDATGAVQLAGNCVKPADRVVTTSNDVQNCTSGTVTTTTETRVWGTTLIENVWTENTQPVITVTSTTRDQTSTEKAACPVVKTELPTPKALAFTGTNDAQMAAGGLLGGAVLLLGGILLATSRRRTTK